MEDRGIVFSGVSFASVRGPVGLAGARWRSVAGSLAGAAFICGQSDVARAVGPKCVAELCNHDGSPRIDFLSGLGAWIFASGMVSERADQALMAALRKRFQNARA